MNNIEFAMHINAGIFYGMENTCMNGGKPKVAYPESAAVMAAEKMSDLYNKDMEAYPCGWCDKWHIGRAMTQEERDLFTPKVAGSDDGLADAKGE